MRAGSILKAWRQGSGARAQARTGGDVCAGRLDAQGGDPEQLCGFEVSSSQVSRAAAELDAVLAAWRTRPLGVYRYVYLDARYEKVRPDGQVRDAVVLLTGGVDAHGKRGVLGVSVVLSEPEVH